MCLIKIIVIKETTFWVFEYEFWVLIQKNEFLGMGIGFGP